MLKKVFDGDFGAYMPGFFTIYLDIELCDKFEYNNFSEQQKATLIHEYIHYLQDISTTQGLANFNYLVDYIRLYLYKINHSEKELTIPLNLETCEVKNAYEQSQLKIIYNGDDRHIKINKINKISREIEECYQDENEMFNINIYYDCNKTPYVFGNICIKESMAYLIETHIYETETREKEFPYNSCEMLCKILYPEISEKYSCIVATCDISLMHYHSGDFFYHLINKMKDEKFLPENSDDIYKYIIPKIEHLYKDFDIMFEDAVNNSNILYSQDNEITI